MINMDKSENSEFREMSAFSPDNDIYVPGNDISMQLADNFQPYECNGGTLVAIAGPDFATIACDTRLTENVSICTRDQNKLFEMGSHTVMGMSGCWCDALGLLSVAEFDVRKYELQNSKPISTDAFAQMISISMYSRRFFPYCVANMVAGLDTKGKGAVFAYDAVGHYERSPYRSAGTASHIITPALDALINSLLDPITIPYALEVTAHSFAMAADIDIYTGDSTIINIITKDGIEGKRMALRRD